MTRRTTLIFIVVVAALGAAAAVRHVARLSTSDSRFHGDPLRRVFDPSRDALADFQTAQQLAATQHKNILMDVGGNWCPSCIVFDHTLRSDPTLQDLLSRNYILLHVNWSSDNENKPLLSRYPEPHGYPALYVLSATGQLLLSQDTASFEQQLSEGDGYSHPRIADFLSKHGPG